MDESRVTQESSCPHRRRPDQIREINAITHIENELIDDACGRVLDWLKARGRNEDTDIFFTTDHGEFQVILVFYLKAPIISMH